MDTLRDYLVIQGRPQHVLDQYDAALERATRGEPRARLVAVADQHGLHQACTSRHDCACTRCHDQRAALVRRGPQGNGNADPFTRVRPAA